MHIESTPSLFTTEIDPGADSGTWWTEHWLLEEWKAKETHGVISDLYTQT